MVVPNLSSQFTLFDIDPTRNNEFLGAATTLANGQLLVVSEDLGSTGDIFMRRFDLNGQSTSALTQVNTATFAAQEDAQVIELSNGNILVAWVDNSRTTPDFSGSATRFQMYDSSGARVGSETVAPTATSGDQDLRTIVALDDGRFAVVWQQGTSAFTSVMRLFNADGTPASADITLPNGFGSSSGGHIVADGAGGLFAVGAIRSLGVNHVVAQRYDASGNPTGDLIEVTQGGTFRDMRVVELANGAHAITWTDTSETPPYNNGPIVRGQVIGANGAPIGSTFTVSEDIFSEHRTSIVTALADGRFAVTWEVRPAGTFVLNGDDVMRIYNADGTPATDILTVYDASEAYTGMRGGLANLQNVSEMPDGRLVYTYSALDPTGGFFLTATRVVDPRSALDVTLGAGNDAYEGTIYNDRINGAEGNDTLNGGDGADTLNGGGGDDFIYGGNSTGDLRDVIFGGDGNDNIDGGYGNDSLNGGAGTDTVSGGFGADTVIGNDGDDLLAGGAGSDLMFGNAGNDTLNGGFGFDRLNGGAGADSFFHLGVADHGSDWVQDYNAAEGDVLTVGIAGATRAQFQVNFTTTPGAGSATVTEAFVIYRPTGQILWALVDGGDDTSINISIGGQVFDLLA